MDPLHLAGRMCNIEVMHPASILPAWVSLSESQSSDDGKACDDGDLQLAAATGEHDGVVPSLGRYSPGHEMVHAVLISNYRAVTASRKHGNGESVLGREPFQVCFHCGSSSIYLWRGPSLYK